MLDKKQPIVIKRIVHGEHEAHGGAWKVALADFVTAMMAFFLLMWLLNITTKEEKAAISEYFNNPSATEGAAPTPAPSSVVGPGGASNSMIVKDGSLDIPRVQPRENRQVPSEITNKQDAEEKKQQDELMDKLKQEIESNPILSAYKEQLLLDITPEGLRIQIVDKENRPMFDSGRANLKIYAFNILQELGKVINQSPNRISISGHTDATKFSSDEDYSNWDLSADRANAARRAILHGGMKNRKVARVLGMASSALFDANDPANPVNRRIAITVLNKKTEGAIKESEGMTEEAVRERQSLLSKPKSLSDLPMEDLGPRNWSLPK